MTLAGPGLPTPAVCPPGRPPELFLMKGTELPQGRGPVRVSGTRTMRIAVTYTARSWAHAARRGLCVQDADTHPTGDRQGLTLNCFTGSSFDVAGRPNASSAQLPKLLHSGIQPIKTGCTGCPEDCVSHAAPHPQGPHQ